MDKSNPPVCIMGFMRKKIDQATDLAETIGYAIVLLFGIACVLAIPYAIWMVVRS